jgi:hypothetical protein
MLRFHETGNFKLEIDSVVKNFEYYPPGAENINPYKSSLQDIFNICVSNINDRHGLKNNILFILRENDVSYTYYSSVMFDDIEGVQYVNCYTFIKSPTGERYITSLRPYFGKLNPGTYLDFYETDETEIVSIAIQFNKSKIELE